MVFVPKAADRIVYLWAEQKIINIDYQIISKVTPINL
jgi:hypothetical protein